MNKCTNSQTTNGMSALSFRSVTKSKGFYTYTISVWCSVLIWGPEKDAQLIQIINSIFIFFLAALYHYVSADILMAAMCYVFC